MFWGADTFSGGAVFSSSEVCWGTCVRNNKRFVSTLFGLVKGKKLVPCSVMGT